MLCVDDHALIREGVALMLESRDDLKLLATAGTGHEAILKFHEHRPDVTLMDLRLPDCRGADVISQLRHTYSNSRFVVLTTYPGDVRALHALRAGATGYLLKSALRTELINTITAVHAGKRCITPEIASEISQFLTADTLSEREVDILRGVSQGQSNKEIAAELRLSEETIRVHLKNVFLKLRAKDRTHAVVIAMRRGFLLD